MCPDLNISKIKLDNSVIGIYGSGGFAREIMPIAKHFIEASGFDDDSVDLVFIDDSKEQPSANGYKVLTFEEYLSIDCERRYFNIGVGDSKTREMLADKCLKAGAEALALATPDAVSFDENTIGLGCVLCSNVVITSNVKIGSFFQANIYSYVAHDCVIGDFVTFAPRVSCNGNVVVEDHAYIGTGAVLRQGTPDKPLVIGEGSIVGMGAVVTKDVAPHTTVIGNPAKLFSKK